MKCLSILPAQHVCLQFEFGVNNESNNEGLLHFREKNLLLSHIGRSAQMENSVGGKT